MTCPRCGHDNPDEARFCLQCGAQLATSCPDCGVVLPPGARFCPECGHALAGAPTPMPYTPRHISEQILAMRAAIEGEHKQVSVLFCDIVASSALAGELGPEEFHLVIDRFLVRVGPGSSRPVVSRSVSEILRPAAQSKPVKLLAAMQNSLPSGSCMTVQRWPRIWCLPMTVAPSRTSLSTAPGSGSTRSM